MLECPCELKAAKDSEVRVSWGFIVLEWQLSNEGGRNYLVELVSLQVCMEHTRVRMLQ